MCNHKTTITLTFRKVLVVLKTYEKSYASCIFINGLENAVFEILLFLPCEKLFFGTVW